MSRRTNAFPPKTHFYTNCTLYVLPQVEVNVRADGITNVYCSFLRYCFIVSFVNWVVVFSKKSTDTRINILPTISLMKNRKGEMVISAYWVGAKRIVIC